MKIEVDADWWKTLFDETYLATDARSVCDAELTGREVDLFGELVPLRKENRILDLCGGHGRHSVELGRRGFCRLTVFDYSVALLRVGQRAAAEQNVPVRFVGGDARSTPFCPDSFDRVLILGNSLGYLHLPEADGQIMAECRRLLAPGGWLLVDVADGRKIRERFSANAWHETGPDADIVVCRQRELSEDRVSARELVLSKKNGIVRDNAYAIRLFDRENLAALIEQSGFSDVRVRCEFHPHRAKGDFGFMNHRMVATARKKSNR